MKGEIKFIKKQMFGGFNRKDMVAYVAKIAHERNEEREAKAAAQERIEALLNEIDALKLELEEYKHKMNEMNKQNNQSTADKAHMEDTIGDEIPEFHFNPDLYIEKHKESQVETVAEESGLKAEVERYKTIHKTSRKIKIKRK